MSMRHVFRTNTFGRKVKPEFAVRTSDQVRLTPVVPVSGTDMQMLALLKKLADCTSTNVNDEVSVGYPNVDKYGRALLAWMARQGRIQDVKTLVEDKGADVTVRDNDKRTPLHLACMTGSLDIVQLLCQHGPPEQYLWRDKNGATPLLWAAKCGWLLIVDFLALKNRESVSMLDKDNTSALQQAIHNFHPKVAELLIMQHGADAFALMPGGSLSVKGDHEVAFNMLVERLPETAKVVLDEMRRFRNREGEFQVWQYNVKNLSSLHVAQMEFYGCQCISPLQKMILCGRKELVSHPTVVALLELKWEEFGKRMFFTEAMWYCLSVMCFTTAAVLTPKSSAVPDWGAGGAGADGFIAVFCLEVLAWLGICKLLLLQWKELRLRGHTWVVLKLKTPKATHLGEGSAVSEIKATFNAWAGRAPGSPLRPGRKIQDKIQDKIQGKGKGKGKDSFVDPSGLQQVQQPPPIKSKKSKRVRPRTARTAGGWARPSRAGVAELPVRVPLYLLDVWNYWDMAAILPVVLLLFYRLFGPEISRVTLFASGDSPQLASFAMVMLWSRVLQYISTTRGLGRGDRI